MGRNARAGGDSARRRLGGALLLASLAGACKLAPAPDQATLIAAALPETTTIPASWPGEESATQPPSGGWVESFGDPELERLVDEALRNNRDLAAAAARVEAARSSVTIAGAPLFPSVGVGLGGTVSSSSESDGTSTFGGGVLSVAWELDLWGKLRSGEAAAVAAATATAEDAVFARLSIAATVAQSWFANVELEELIALAREEVRGYQRLAALARRKEAAGEVSNFDVVQAQGRLDAARAAIAELQQQRNAVLAGLEVLLGRYPSLTLEPRSELPPMPPPIPAGSPPALLDRRPDVRAAQNQVVAAFYDVEVAKLARLPVVSLAVSGGRLFDPDIGLLATGLDFVRAGAALLQPIFEGGALQAEVERMSADQRAATARYGETVLTAYSEVETFLANERVLREAVASWRKAVANANEAVRLGVDAYVAGAIDMVDLLNLQQFAIDRRVDLIESRAALLQNRVSLALALGQEP